MRTEQCNNAWHLLFNCNSFYSHLDIVGQLLKRSILEVIFLSCCNFSEISVIAKLVFFHCPCKHYKRIQFSSVAQLYPTLCDTTNHSTPGLPIHHQLPSPHKPMSVELVMPFNHLILCRPLLLLPSIFPNLRALSNVSSSHQVAKILEFQLQHQSLQWTPRTDLL